MDTTEGGGMQRLETTAERIQNEAKALDDVFIEFYASAHVKMTDICNHMIRARALNDLLQERDQALHTAAVVGTSVVWSRDWYVKDAIAKAKSFASSIEKFQADLQKVRNHP